MADTCKSCAFFERTSKAETPPVPGICLWEPPPFIERMIDMLQGEPATQIDWKATSATPPATHSEHHCSAWMPANAAVARLRRLMRN